MPYRPNFPIPENIHAELMCLCIQIPNDPTWKSVVAGLLYELQYWFNWQRDEERSGRECAAVWKEIYLNIDWSTMSCCCDDNPPVRYRWTEDGTLEKSTDAGETWTPAPEDDTRNSSPQFPPLPDDETEQVRCDMAASVAEAINQQVGLQLTEDMSRFELDELIETWTTTYLETWNPLLALIQIAANQIFSLGVAAVIAALTEEVYEDLKCIVLDHMPDSGEWSAAEAEALRADVQSSITGIAGLFLQHLIYLMGAVGLTNLSRSGFVVDADCAECNDTIGIYLTTENFGIFDGIVDGAYQFQGTTDGPGAEYTLYIQFVPDAAYCSSPSDCHYLTLEETVVGIIDQAFCTYTTCGTCSQVNKGLTNFNEISTATWVLVSSDPFTVRLTASDIPG